MREQFKRFEYVLHEYNVAIKDLEKPIYCHSAEASNRHSDLQTDERNWANTKTQLHRINFAILLLLTRRRLPLKMMLSFHWLFYPGLGLTLLVKHVTTKVI